MWVKRNIECICVFSLSLIFFIILAKAKDEYYDWYNKFRLEGCDPENQRIWINTNRISLFKLKTNPPWVSLSAESRVVFSECFHNQIPSSWKDIYTNSSFIVYLKKNVSGTEFFDYRITYKAVEDPEDQNISQSFVQLIFQEVELGENFALVDKGFKLKLFCLKSAFATIKEGYGFVFCGGCEPENKKIGINTDQISLFKFKTNPQWVSLSTESRVVFSECFHNQIPSSWKDIYTNSSSVVYLKKNVSGTEFFNYRITYKAVQDPEDQNISQSFVQLIFREVELGKNYTHNFALVDKDFKLKLFCLKSAFATIKEGHGFVFCGETTSMRFRIWLTEWKDRVTESKSTRSRQFVITLVSIIVGMMVSCLVCCLCCNCWKTRRDAKKGVRGRRGSNMSSSLRTREIEV